MERDIALAAGTGGRLGNGSTSSSATPVPVVGGHTFAAVLAAPAETCGITMAGAAYCWGGYNDGGASVGSNLTPTAVPGGHAFASISAYIHACGVTTAGIAYCWGANSYGELGNGTKVGFLTRVRVADPQ